MPRGAPTARPRPILALDRRRWPSDLSVGLPEGDAALSNRRHLLSQGLSLLDHSRRIKSDIDEPGFPSQPGQKPRDPESTPPFQPFARASATGDVWKTSAPTLARTIENSHVVSHNGLLSPSCRLGDRSSYTQRNLSMSRNIDHNSGARIVDKPVMAAARHRR